MKDMRKILYLIVIIAVVIGITYWVNPSQFTGSDATIPEQRPDAETVVVESEYVRYPGEEGKNAFELLRKYAEVDFDEFDFGVYVKGIDGSYPESQDHFWKLYYNGVGAQVGATDLQTSDSDIVEWKIEVVDENL